MNKRATIVLLFSFCGVLASVSSMPAPSDDTAQVTPTTAEGPLVKVTIASSRVEVTSEGGYGVFADLQNIDTVPLRLLNGETMLVVQPELAGDHTCVFTVTGFYPTEDAANTAVAGAGAAADSADQVIIIQPKEHYVAFWDVRSRGPHSCSKKADSDPKKAVEKRSFWSYFLDSISFTPGNYAFVVVGKAYRLNNERLDVKYHTYTDQVKLHVGLRQLDAIFAAMLGGLLAYLVTALRREGDFSRFTAIRSSEPFDAGRAWRNFGSAFVVVRNMVSAAFVSAAVTILLSRISDTQFPVKVSVADFWGALTIGFIAFFLGNKLIDRIVGLSSNPPATDAAKSDVALSFKNQGKFVTTLDFGQVALNAFKTLTVEVVNSGKTALVLPKASLAPGASPFAIESDHVSNAGDLNPGEGRTVQVTFKPSVAGSAAGTLGVTASNLASAVNLLLTSKADEGG